MATGNQSTNYLDGSALARLGRQIQAYLAATWIVRMGVALSDRFATAFDTSALAKGGQIVTSWFRQSFIYRWLTTEPDPDVIVIDLRETYTVGPVIALLDRLVPTVDRMWRGSLVARATRRLQSAGNQAWLTESRTIRLLRAALEPPEPPDSEPHN
ncbi:MULTISPECIES: hypothetical protein [Halorussus]|uniref:hypothetical protein n=1 Tax=Halorussus TaxID=1070314 RepID=UPI000E20FC36|nr:MULTISPECIES: hypothetical protein [Halorussus]NHN60133.1 hypothetical protein [Halorussus sp. JP-T4]